MEVKTLSVPCPNCKKEVLMTEASKFRPFCTKRCRDIDFGAWAKEEYAVPENSAESDVWSDDLDSPDSY